MFLEINNKNLTIGAMSCIGQKYLSKPVQYSEEAFHQTACVLDLNFNFKHSSNILIIR